MHKNSNYSILGTRELQILNAFKLKKDTKTIAEELRITEYTVNAHIKTISRKMELAGLPPILLNIAI